MMIRTEKKTRNFSHFRFIAPNDIYSQDLHCGNVV